MLWIIFFISVLVAFSTTRLSIVLSLRRGVLDLPNPRSSHFTPVPRLGGLGILAGVVLSSATLLAVRIPTSPGNPTLAHDILPVLLVGVGMGLTGLYDDLCGIAPGTKLVGQLILAGTVVALGVRIESLSLLGWGPISVGILAVPATILWLTCFANIFNFMDGINGMAAVTAVAYSSFFFVFASWQGSPNLAAVALVVIGSCLGFLPYNLPRARTFMGDTGSLFLGILLASLVVRIAQKSANPACMIGLLLVCSPYLWDTGFTLLRRLRRRENIFQAHRGHLYQRLAQLGLSHGSITSVYLFLHLLMGSLGLAYVRSANLLRAEILSFAALTLVGFTAGVYGLERRALRAKQEASRMTPRD